MNDLSPDEKDLIRSLRAARGKTEEPLPRLTAEELVRRLRARAGLTGDTPEKTIRLLQHITGEAWLPPAATGRKPAPYEGPRVLVHSTLTALKVSVEQHEEDLIAKRRTGAVVRHHREAVARYCRALGLDWQPPPSRFEQRWRRVVARRDESVELPDDFVTLTSHIVNDLVYAKDPAHNEMYRHRARLSGHTGPRVPSECGRLRVRDISFDRATVTYYVSKIGLDGGAVLVPREAFGLRPTVLTHPKRRSAHRWLTTWRPQLVERSRKLAERAGTEWTEPEHMWLNARGAPADAQEFRTTLAVVGKTVWPSFHPYMLRELAFIMYAVSTIEETGSVDLERCIQWSGHESIDVFRRYTRKARKLHRDLGEDRAQLRALLQEWNDL